MKITKFTLIQCEYNEWNGFIFELFGLEAETDKHDFNGALFGIYTYRGLAVELGFIRFEIRSPFL